jgi:hypothetical protein
MLSNAAYTSLNRAIQALQASATASDIVYVISEWVSKYSELMVKDPYSNFGFDLIGRVAGNVHRYAPVELDDQGIERIKKSFARIRKSNDAGIAQCVRDLMEELLAPEVDATCMTCGEDFMQGFASERTSRLILQCVRGGHIQFGDGLDAAGESLRFLTADELPAINFHLTCSLTHT